MDRKALPTGLATLVLLTALTGCGGNEHKLIDDPTVPTTGTDTPGTDTTGPTDPVSWRLDFKLRRHAAAAGDLVEYEAWLISELGSALPATGALVSDLEPDVVVTDTDVLLTTAGLHTFTLTVDHDGQTLIDDDFVDVTAGPLADVELRLDAAQTVAGEPLGYQILGADTWGNPLDLTGYDLVTDDPTVVITPDAFTATQAAWVKATLTLDEHLDADRFEVVPAPAALLDLELDAQGLAAGDTAVATVTITDTHGNATGDAYTLWVEGDATVVGNAITFHQEGAYAVHAESGSLSDVVHLIVDDQAPDLEVTEPPRATWTIGTHKTVRGTAHDEVSGPPLVTVSGAPVDVDPVDGSFTHEYPLIFGLNVVATDASDLAGNLTTDRRAMLAGATRAYGSPISHGLEAFLFDGPGGLDTLEAFAADAAEDALDLEGILTNPVFEDEEETCVWGACITWYAIELNIYDPTFSHATVDIDTRDGSARLVLNIHDVHLDWQADAVVAEIPASGTGDITIDRVEVTMDVALRVVNGALQVDILPPIQTRLYGFDFQMDSWLQEVLEFFNAVSLIEDLVTDAVAGAVEDAAENDIKPLVEDLLSQLTLGFDLPLLGRTYAIDAPLSQVVSKEEGLLLSMNTSVTVDQWVIGDDGPGPLYMGWQAIDFAAGPATPGTHLGLSVDFLNQLFYALWGGGALSFDTTSGEIGLDAQTLGLLFPGVAEARFEVVPRMPPMVVPGTGDHMFDLQLGGLEVVVTDVQTELEVMRGYVHVVAGLDLEVSPDGTALAAVIDAEPHVEADVVFPTENEAKNEELALALVPELLPVVTEALEVIEIPAIEGFSLTHVTARPNGDRNGTLDLAGDLVEAP